jgi:general secretion pathway protein M
MPFLFVDQLVAHAPLASAGPQQGRMRLLLTVYGQWQGGR